MNAYQRASVECWAILKKYDLTIADGIKCVALMHSTLSDQADSQEAADALLLACVAECRVKMQHTDSRRGGN